MEVIKMCLFNEKPLDKESVKGFKIFRIEDGELHSIKREFDFPYKKGINTTEYGFHAFKKKKDAEQLIDTLSEKPYKDIFMKQYKYKTFKFVIKQVIISDNIYEGFAYNHFKQMETDENKQPLNAIRGKKMEVI
jgi:hypothetical protein